VNSETPFSANLLTGVKPPTFSTNHVADIDSSKNEYNNE